MSEKRAQRASQKHGGEPGLSEQEKLAGQAKAELPISFEQALEELELIVARLDGGDVPLETAIELFQEGMRLSQLCSGKLEQVEQKIELLLESDQGMQRKPFTTAYDE